MKGPKKFLLALLIVMSAAGVIALAYPVYQVMHSANDTQLMWNDSEAYLFVRSSRLGYRRNLLRFAFDFVGARFGILPSDTKSDLLIVRLTNGGIEENNLPDTAITRLGVLDNRIYTYANGSLVRLAGSRFELVGADERQRFESANALLTREGWSFRSNLLTGPSGTSKVIVSVGGQPWTVLAHNNRSTDGSTAIDVQKGDEPPKRVWYLDTRPRYTNSDEYATFLSEGRRG